MTEIPGGEMIELTNEMEERREESQERRYLGIDGAGSVDSYLFLFWGCSQGFFISVPFLCDFYCFHG